jgi:protocatechuate 3,4-dioxygenase beta subunit
MEMAPTGTLAGRVLDADGEPMSQVLVMALQEQYVEGRRVLKLMQAIPTDDRGDYRFFSTPPGRYYLAARVSDFRFEARGSQVLAGRMAGSELASEPYVIRTNLPNGEVLEETYRLVYFDGALNPETAKFIDLLPGANLAGMNISVGIGKTAVHHIRGLLINNTTGQPAAGRRVLAVPREPSPNLLVAAGSTDERGVFDLSGVIPGRYVLVSNWPGTGDPSTRVVGMMTFVEVGNTDLENVRIFGAVPLYLPGLVIVETGPQGGDALDLTKIRIGLTRDPDTLGLPPLPPAATVSSVVGVPAIGEVGRDGAFTLQMSPGDYRVTVTGIPANTYIKSIRMGNTDVLRGGFHHDGAAENRLEIVIGADAGELRGIALNEKREPMSNVVVSLVPDLPAASQRLDLYKSTTTDVTGRFQIPTIAPGDYRLFVWEYVEPGAWQNPQFLQPYEVFGKSIHIDAGSKQETQSLVIPSRQY